MDKALLEVKPTSLYFKADRFALFGLLMLKLSGAPCLWLGYIQRLKC